MQHGIMDKTWQWQPGVLGVFFLALQLAYGTSVLSSVDQGKCFGIWA